MAVEQYRQYIQHLLSERRLRASMQQRNAEEYEVQTIFDDHHSSLPTTLCGLAWK